MVGVVMSPLGNSRYSRWRPKMAGKIKFCVFVVHIGMQYVSIYVFEGADHEFDSKFGITPSHNIHGQKIARAGCAPFFGGAGSPSNTKSPGLRPTSILSGILIHSAVWPQRTWAANWGLCPFWRGSEYEFFKIEDMS